MQNFNGGSPEMDFTTCKSQTETCWITFGSITDGSVPVVEADENPQNIWISEVKVFMSCCGRYIC